MWEKPVSHGEILKSIWKNLDLGTLDRKHPFHLPTFSTIADNAPSLRVVVLRRFWRKPPQLAFHSHIGSPKSNKSAQIRMFIGCFIIRKKSSKSASKARQRFTRAAICTRNNGSRPSFFRAVVTLAKPRQRKAKDRLPVCLKV